MDDAGFFLVEEGFSNTFFMDDDGFFFMDDAGFFLVESLSLTSAHCKHMGLRLKKLEVSRRCTNREHTRHVTRPLRNSSGGNSAMQPQPQSCQDKTSPRSAPRHCAAIRSRRLLGMGEVPAHTGASIR